MGTGPDGDSIPAIDSQGRAGAIGAQAGCAGSSGADCRDRQRGEAFGELARVTIASEIRILSAQPWVLWLGWTLVHFLWQDALIATAYAGARGWVGLTRNMASGWNSPAVP